MDTEPKVVATEAGTTIPTETHETPFVDEPVAKESVAEQPIVEKPVVEQPVVEKPSRDGDITPKPKGYIAPAGLRTSMEMQTEERLDEIIKEGEKSPTSPESPRGVKGWLKTRFRRQSKTQKSDSKETGADNQVVGVTTSAEIGNTRVEPDISSAKDTEPRKTTIPEAARAGPSTTHEKPVEIVSEERTGRSKRRASSISSVSALEEGQDIGKEVSRDDNFGEARDHFDNDLAPPPTFPTTKSASPVRDSRFHEEM